MSEYSVSVKLTMNRKNMLCFCHMHGYTIEASSYAEALHNLTSLAVTKHTASCTYKYTLTVIVYKHSLLRHINFITREPSIIHT